MSKEYIPLSLRLPKLKERPVMYGIGIAQLDESFGMTHGPSENVDRLLDEVGDNGSYIIRFNSDGTDDVIWKWSKDRWLSVE